MFLLTVFASLAFATEEIKRARLEVGMIIFNFLFFISTHLAWHFADLWWMTIEFASEGEAVHQRSPSRIVSFNLVHLCALNIILFDQFFFG